MKILVTGGSGFIGTNLTETLHRSGIQFINVDIAAPKNPSLKSQWRKCDIMNYPALQENMQAFQPTAVVHLAAETDTDPFKTLDDYKVNTEGSQNVLNAIRSCPSVERVIFTSTQFVNQRDMPPRDDEDYHPHTVYGESKIMAEQALRNADLKCAWTIIRPTNIWGPWHLRYPYEFWKVLAENKYVHPGKKKVIRSYGYVGNVVHQIMRILQLSPEKVDKKVFYVGDRAIDLYEWVNLFSLKQTGKKVRIMPRFVVWSLALLGDILRTFKIKFPITMSRYRSMTTDNPAYMEKTFEELGESPYTLEQGVDETVHWMKANHPHLINK
jgi:GlcNAc-P-P-Und epimerase